MNKPPDILKSKSTVVFYRLRRNEGGIRDGEFDLATGSTLGSGILCSYDPDEGYVQALPPHSGWYTWMCTNWQWKFTVPPPLELLAAQ